MDRASRNSILKGGFMSDQQYTVREFIRMTPPQKMRLQKRDPEQYEKLKKSMEKNFNKESDPAVLADLINKK